jgi:uncharacterized membrane protein
MIKTTEDIASESEATFDQVPSANACPYCKRQKGSERIAGKEMVIAAVCAILLLVIAVPLICASENWLECQVQRSLDHLFWRERIEQW